MCCYYAYMYIIAESHMIVFHLLTYSEFYYYH